MRFEATGLLFAGALLAYAAQAAMPPEAARFPERPIRIIVPFAPGGGTDFIARLAGPRISERWGQPVIIDNRPGASATIGADIVAKAPADGYTFGIINAEHTIVPSVYLKMPYHPVRDFSPITQTVDQFYVLVVHPSVQASSVKEVIGAIKARGGRFNFGTAHWSVGHLAGELFKLRAGVEMTHIPYKGTGPAITDLLGGQISLMFSTAPPALPHVRAGKLRAIAITATSRSPLLPDLPTVAESGMPGFEASGWNGFVAPGRTPRPIVAKLNQEIVRILALPDVRDQLARSGVEPVGSQPGQFASHIERELAKWAKVVKDANLRLEQ
jgi:tripartite-type tricarboxylate transporter receptor subunit TctC